MRCQHFFRVEVSEMLVEVGIAFYSSPTAMVQWKTGFIYFSCTIVPFSVPFSTFINGKKSILSEPTNQL